MNRAVYFKMSDKKTKREYNIRYSLCTALHSKNRNARSTVQTEQAMNSLKEVRVAGP